MNCCNLIIRKYGDSNHITGITFDVYKHQILINEDRNTRWIKENNKMPFFEWLIDDVRANKYKIIYEIPFHGDIHAGVCTLLTINYLENHIQQIRHLGVCTNDSDFKELLEEFHLELWNKYTSDKSHSYNDFEQYIDSLNINTIYSEKIIF
jgi:hypothetical protein